MSTDHVGGYVDADESIFSTATGENIVAMSFDSVEGKLYAAVSRRGNTGGHYISCVDLQRPTDSP